MKTRICVLTLIVVLLLAACGPTNASELPENRTVVVSFASFMKDSKGATIEIYQKNFTVNLVHYEGYARCQLSEVDWSELRMQNEKLIALQEAINQDIEILFGNSVSLVELDQFGNWYPDDIAEEMAEGQYVCPQQWIVYRFEDSLEIPWNKGPNYYVNDEPYHHPDEPDPVQFSEKLGSFYFDIYNPETGAHLGLSIPTQRFYDLAFGHFLQYQDKLSSGNAKLRTVKKSPAVTDFGAREVASFSMPQDDFQSREIFVKMLEGTLPLLAEVDSISYVQSFNQFGQESQGELTGSANSHVGGLIFGGWGFVSGSSDSSVQGSYGSKPIVIVRGSVYLLPNP